MKQVEEMEVAEMKMLRFAMGVTRKYKIETNTVKVEQLGIKMRGQAEVVWSCHEERPGVRRKKGDGNGVTGKEKKREAEEIFGCSKGRYRGSWCEGEGY